MIVDSSQFYPISARQWTSAVATLPPYHHMLFQFPNNQQSTLAEGLVVGNYLLRKRITSSRLHFYDFYVLRYSHLSWLLRCYSPVRHTDSILPWRLTFSSPRPRNIACPRWFQGWWDLTSTYGLFGMGQHRQNMEFWKSLESWQMPFVPATPSSPWMTKSFQPSDQNPKQFLMKGVEPLLDERDSIALRASQQADWSAWVSCNQFFCVICRLKCLRALAEFDSALTCLLLLCCLLLFAKVPC